MAEPLRDEMHDFIREHLKTIAAVDAVLFLLKNPTRAWTTDEVASELTVEPEATAERLSALASEGLVSCAESDVPKYRYVISDDEEDRMLRDLAEVCAADRTAVVNALAGGPPQGPLRRLAAALGFRR